MSLSLAAALLALVGVAHSVLGEVAVVGPLLRNPDWRLRMGRLPAARVIRFAWHLTTAAWWALAAVAWGVTPAVALAVLALGSAVVIVAMLPGHVAWPVFLASAVLAGASAWGDSLHPFVAVAVTVTAVVAAVTLGLLARRGQMATWSAILRRGASSPGSPSSE